MPKFGRGGQKWKHTGTAYGHEFVEGTCRCGSKQCRFTETINKRGLDGTWRDYEMRCPRVSVTSKGWCRRHTQFRQQFGVRRTPTGGLFVGEEKPGEAMGEKPPISEARPNQCVHVEIMPRGVEPMYQQCGEDAVPDATRCAKHTRR